MIKILVTTTLSNSPEDLIIADGQATIAEGLTTDQNHQNLTVESFRSWEALVDTDSQQNQPVFSKKQFKLAEVVGVMFRHRGMNHEMYFRFKSDSQ